MLWIRRVKLPAFGRFTAAEFSFEPGMNLIYGRNEAGKSTLFTAISAALFGLKRDKERYVPWHGPQRCEASLELVFGDSEVTIARDLLTDRVKAVETRGGKAVWQFEGKASPLGRSSEREEYLTKIETIWGVAEEDIFRNSVYVGQQDLRIEAAGGLNARIKQLLSGYTELDYDAVVQGLENDLYELTRKPGGRSRDRELEEVRARMAELALLWREANQIRQQIEPQESELATLKTTLDAGRLDLEKGSAYLDRVKKYHELTARELSLQAEADRIGGDLQKVEKLLSEKEEFERRLTPLARLTSLPEEFPGRLQAFIANSESLARLRDELQELESIPRSTGGSGLVWSYAALAAALLSGVAAWYLKSIYPAVPAVIFLVSFVLLFARGGKVRKEQEASAAKLEGRMEGVRGEIGRRLVDNEEFSEKYRSQVGDVSAGRMEDICRELEQSKTIQAGISQVERALQVLPTRDELMEKSSELSRALNEVKEQAAAISGKGFPLISPEEVEAAADKLRRLAGEVREQEQEYQQKEQSLELLRQSSPDVEAIEEEGEELKGRELRLVKRVRGLRLAIELLRETLDEYRATYLTRFSGEINGKLYNLTAGRYRETALDDAFNLFIGADGSLRPIEAYSCGVRDQAYLASRLALGEILSHGRKLPFLLDDPLVNFDDERKQAALTSLGLLAKEHQVLLFVHDERYLKLKGSDSFNRIRLEERGKQDGQLHLL